VLYTQGLVCTLPLLYGTGRDRLGLWVELATSLGADSEMMHCDGYSKNDVCGCYESWTHVGDCGYEISSGCDSVQAVRKSKRGQMYRGRGTYLSPGGAHLLGEDMRSQWGASQRARLRAERTGHSGPYHDDNGKASLMDGFGSLRPALAFWIESWSLRLLFIELCCISVDLCK